MSPIRVDPQPLLVVIPNVIADENGTGLYLDIKARDGLSLYAAAWPGPVRAIFRKGAASEIGYGRWTSRDDLPFEVTVVSTQADAQTLAAEGAGASVVLAGADSHLDLSLATYLTGVPVAYIIEYTLRTRIEILHLSSVSAFRKLKSLAWLLLTERRRRRALARSAGLQANGTPAFRSYRHLSRNPMLFFDTRLTAALTATEEDLQKKQDQIRSGAPLRLVFSGRLERMKGADELVRIVDELVRSGSSATLDIFGDGPLAPEIQAEANRCQLADRVRFRGAVSFADTLVPTLKREADLFLCPHPQGDPSCTYLETLGCAVPIAGYLNPAFRGVLELGPCGVGAPVGRHEQLARQILALDHDRNRLAELCEGALAVARTRTAEDVFVARVAHLRSIARV